MAPPLFPALTRFDREAAIIGRLLTGYTAIEWQLCLCSGMGGGDVECAIVDLYRKRGETRRVQLAEAFGKSGYDAVGISNRFHCVRIRNQYAHAYWHDDRSGRLAFAHVEEIAAPNGSSGERAEPARSALIKMLLQGIARKVRQPVRMEPSNEARPISCCEFMFQLLLSSPTTASSSAQQPQGECQESQSLQGLSGPCIPPHRFRVSSI